MNLQELLAERARMLDQMRSMVEKAENENRDLSPDEDTQYKDLRTKAEDLTKRIERRQNLPVPGAPMINQLPLGDNPARALSHYFKSGDTGGVRSMLSYGDESENRGRPEIELRMPGLYEKRATDEIMNVTTAADGGNAVPTGFVNQIAARRAEASLPEKLGCQLVPGKGLTVNYPYENADAAVFATTTEQVDAYGNVYERDRPTLGAKAFTLVKKTKKIVLTEELLNDEDANLLGFIADHIGRAMGLTLNTAMLTEIGANGISVTIGTTTTISAGDPEKFAFHATLGYYIDDTGQIAWVMRPPTFGVIKNITGNSRLYDDQTARGGLRTLLEYPVYYSQAAAAIAASAKTVYFGNWRYMGYRLDPGLTLIRDPYTTDGVVLLKYSFRTVFGILIGGALAYGVHPSA